VTRYHPCPGCGTRVKDWDYFACKACWAWLRNEAPALALAINQASRQRDYAKLAAACVAAGQWFANPVPQTLTTMER